MPDQDLVKLITQRVVNRLSNDKPCSGCALRTCDAGNRACDVAGSQQKIPVGVSARHAHVTQEHLEILYGPGHQLTVYAPLYQPEAFAANETVTVVGKRMRAIEHVRILGPVRDYSQVEVAKTEAIRLGLDPPIRDSGDLDGAEAITLIGPAGSVYLEEGAICASRHIHMTPEQAQEFGLTESDRVKIRIPGERALTFENIRPKIHESYVLQMHLDTDDSNAAGLKGGEAVELVRDEV
ncbi:phosphate propanoyltransferase [Candidatus Poribacteria bacterium]|nr:phosphate propanoyltransferase [Candidatus Poribacteria bacterium]